MSVCFLGDSHAPKHLALGARKRGVEVVEAPNLADVIFISQDTETTDQGQRNLEPIRERVHLASRFNKQMVLTSQVPPGFTRSLGIKNIYHQAETLRIKDAEYRAEHPDYIAVGGPEGINRHYAEYLLAFKCPVIRMTWEEAEFSKIAVNMMLAAQVDYTNRMKEYCDYYGADWKVVSKAIKYDKRIGQEAYLTPGRWQDSKHLLRDYYTLEAIRTS